MTNAADIAADGVRGFSVDLERFSADIHKRALSAMKDLEEELAALLRKHDQGAVTLTSAKRKRAETLLAQVRATIASSYAKIRNEVHSDLREVAQLSSENAGSSINEAVGVDIATTGLAPEQIRAMVDGTLIQGAPSKQWWADQAATTLRNFTDQVQKGYASGEGVDAIVRRIIGTAANNFTDGVMNVSRRNAEALIRTSVQAISNSARNETFDNNDDIIENLQQISTLDGRTTLICKARSGLQWNLITKDPVGHSIPWNSGPPLHWSCRSAIIAVLKPLDDIPPRKKKAIEDAGTQSSMDGQVAGDMDYQDWLRTKSVQFQKDALGEGKWQLWKAGKVTLPQMLDMRGNPLTLAELQRKYGGGGGNDVPGNEKSTPAKPVFEVVITKGSDVFRERVNDAVSQIPREIQEALARNGKRVEAGEFVTDSMPELKGIQPRGWPEGSTWDMVDGLYSPQRGAAVVAEYTRQRNGEVYLSDRTKGVVLHETGHAFDAVGLNETGEGFSQSPEFYSVYDLERKNIFLTSGEKSSRYSYVLQEGNAGASEAFAELFNEAMGGEIIGGVSDALPETKKVMDRILARYRGVA